MRLLRMFSISLLLLASLSIVACGGGGSTSDQEANPSVGNNPQNPVSDDTIDNCPDVENPDQTDSDGDGTGDACETYNGFPVKFLTNDEKNLWNGTYEVTSNDCTWDTPTSSGITVWDSDKSRAQLALHYSNAPTDYYNGIFIIEESADSIQLMFDVNESWRGSAITSTGFIAGKQKLSVKFYDKSNVAHSCSIWFNKQNTNTTTPSNPATPSNPTTPINTYAVGGTISGLGSSEQVILQNNGGDSLTVNENGRFIFPTKNANGTEYKVTIQTSPNQKICAVSNGTGILSGLDITNVNVSCSVNSSETYKGYPIVYLTTAEDELWSGSYDSVNSSCVSQPITASITLNESNKSQAQLIIRYDNSTTDYFTGKFVNISTPFFYFDIGNDYHALAVTNGDLVNGKQLLLINYYLNNSVLSICNNLFSKSNVSDIETYSVGGTVSGLGVGEGVILQNNNWDDLTVNANGGFVFSTKITSGSGYNISVLTSPNQKTCIINNGSGNISNSDVTNVNVVCSAKTYNVRGTVSGLNTGESITLQNNSTNNTTINANGAFVFSNKVVTGGGYEVTVLSFPAHKTCVVNDGKGTVSGADITNVNVVCSINTYTIEGSVSGLGSGYTLILRDNGSDNLTINNDGRFVFSTKVADGSGYNVTIMSSPNQQTCTVNNGIGTVEGTNVTNIDITCSINTYEVGGNISGLGANEEVVLQNNNEDDLTISANGNFLFPTKMVDDDTYSVSILEKPVSKTCIVNKGTGIIHGNVTNIGVVCSTNTYSVGGTVTGLGVDEEIVLQNNNTDDLVVDANGEFNFSTKIAYGEIYSVSVFEKPTIKTCTINKGAGAIYSNVTNIAIVCSINTYDVGGTVSGLGIGEEVILQNNSADDLAISSNGVFVFPDEVAVGGGYKVTVLNSPSHKTCTVNNGIGTVSGLDVTNVSVVCSVNIYTVGGTVAGLINGSNLVLQNNEVDDLIISSDDSFVFATAIVEGMTYDVSIKTEPIGQTCTVSNESGTASANVANVVVECTTNTYTIGGSVSGLSTGEEVILKNNGGDNLTVNSNGEFEFSTQIDHGDSYKITVETSPSQKGCIVSSGAGTVSGSDVTNVSVACISLWAKSVTTGLNSSLFSAVSVDANGNIYAVGSLSGADAFNFGGGVIVIGNNNGVIVKYSSDGTAQWAKSVTGDYCEGSNFTGVSVALDGSIYAVGEISPSVCNFGNGVTINGSTSGNGGGIVVKYNSAGTTQWGRVVTTTSNTSSFFSGISIDVDGSVYAGGRIYGTGVFDFGNSVTISSTYSGGSIVIVKYNSAGSAQWAKSIVTATGRSAFSGVSTDATGVYAVGTINGTGTFNFGNSVIATGTNTNENIVIVKYNSSGTPQWAKSITTGLSNSSFTGVSATTNGNVYAVGYINGTDTFNFGNGATVNGSYTGQNSVVVKYNASGSAQWAKSVTTGPASSYFSGASVDANGSFYAVGNINGTEVFNFGSGSTVSGTYSNRNVVIVKYDASGSAQWAKSVTAGLSTSIFNGVSAGLDGSIYAIGYISGANAFDFGNGVSVSSPYSGGNAVIVKYLSE